MKSEFETTLDIEGMTCASCVRHVSSALRAVGGVTDVQVNLREGRALIRHDASESAVRALIDALTAAGYASRPAG